MSVVVKNTQATNITFNLQDLIELSSDDISKLFEAAAKSFQKVEVKSSSNISNKLTPAQLRVKKAIITKQLEGDFTPQHEIDELMREVGIIS